MKFNKKLHEKTNRRIELEAKRAAGRRKSDKKAEETQEGNNNAPSLDGFEYVPSIGLYVGKQKELHESDWNACQTTLQGRGDRMPTISEYIAFISHLRTKNDEEARKILDEIYTVRSPWRSEWLDAKFEVKSRKRTMKYHVFTDSGIEQKTVDLTGVLMEDKTPGISLDSWLGDNKYGLPKQDIQDGQLYYWYPRNNRVARFRAASSGAYLGCGGIPAYSDASFGVRAVRRASAKN
jgi:hypothetical protein